LLTLVYSPTLFSQDPSDYIDAISRPHYVYENKSFELEFLVAGHTTSWNPHPSYLVEGSNIVVFYARMSPPLPTPAPPVVNILVSLEVPGLPVGKYSVYVAPYYDEAPIEFDFAGTSIAPRGSITIYPGEIDLDLGLGAPKAGAIVSGFGIIRGWACYSQDAKPTATRIANISYQIDGGGIKPVPYGTSRSDVTERCLGQTATGFAAPVNWNRFSLGAHTFKLFVDGEEAVRHEVIVSGTGETYLKGLEAEYTLENFPNEGDSTTVKWSQSAQDFTIIGVDRAK